MDLKTKLVRLIEASGPISVADFMATCLLDPRHGYYTTRQPFGVDGDFITAPEISQMFGELVGVWVYSTWKTLGAHLPVTVAEIGPGRGTLFRDMVRTFNTIDPSFASSATLVLIEASPRLRSVQQDSLAAAGVGALWLDTIAALPSQPTLFVGNEIFDALPVHQYVKTPNGWRERRIGLETGDSLCFVAGAGSPDGDLLPPGAEEAAMGAICELAPARSALMEEICGILAKQGGAGLFFDYGYGDPSVGETLQAVLGHRFSDVLSRPGEADLTAHVDFAALRRAAATAGLTTYFDNQGKFLIGMGLLERAGALGRGANEIKRTSIKAEVDRIAAPDQMGDLFKVLAVLPHGTPVHPFGPD